MSLFSWHPPKSLRSFFHFDCLSRPVTDIQEGIEDRFVLEDTNKTARSVDTVSKEDSLHIGSYLMLARLAVYVDSPYLAERPQFGENKRKPIASQLEQLVYKNLKRLDTNKKSTKASCSFLKLVPFADCRKRHRLDSPNKLEAGERC